MYLQGAPILFFVVLSVFWGLGLYPSLGLGSAEALRRMSIGSTLVVLFGIALTFTSQVGDQWSRQVFLTSWLFVLPSIPLARFVCVRLLCPGGDGGGVVCGHWRRRNSRAGRAVVAAATVGSG